MKPSDAAKLWTMIATAYPDGMRWLGHQLDATAKLYRDFLLDLDYAAADAAVRRLIATWTPTSANRWPPIPVLRGAVLAQQAGRPRTGIEAWGDLRRLTGSYLAERLDEIDPLMRRCIEDLGWVHWHAVYSAERGEFQKWTVSSDSENEASDRARFCELYDRLASAAQEDAVVGRLAPPLPQRRIGMGAGIAALLPDIAGKR